MLMHNKSSALILLPVLSVSAFDSHVVHPSCVLSAGEQLTLFVYRSNLAHDSGQQLIISALVPVDQNVWTRKTKQWMVNRLPFSCF